MMGMHRVLRCAQGRSSHRSQLRLEALELRTNPSQGTMITVDDDLAQNKNANFTSIQAAVDAAGPGDRIRVFPGTYQEQVFIPSKLNNLELRAIGKPGTTIIAPTSFSADPSEAIIHVAGAQNVSIRGFVITGEAAPSGFANGANYGVLVDQGGSANVRDNHITTIRDLTLSGEQEGIGIQFGFTDSMGTVLSSGQGEAEHNLIEDYQKGGIVVIGADSQADIEHNEIRGVGATDVIAQNGIQVSDDASATIRHNRVFDNNYTIPTVVAVGILVFEADDVEIEHNLVSDNNDGIHVDFSEGTSVEHNRAIENTHDGILLFEATNSNVAHNVSSRNGNDGITIDVSTNNRVTNNFTFSNGRYGIAIEATATDNVVRFNHLGDNVLDDLFVGNPDNDVSKNHFQP